MSSQSIRIVDPDTGLPLLAGATLTNRFMLIASQIFVYNIPRTGPQHTDFLKEPFVLDCQSYAIGLTLLTEARQGQIHQMEVIGSGSSGGASKVT